VRGFFENQKAPRVDTIQTLFQQGYGTATAAVATLTATASIGTLAAALRQQATVVVQTAQGNRAVTTPDLLAYLATKEVD